MALTRSDRPIVRQEPAHTLSTKQRRVLEIITQYYRNTGEPCSARYIARRMSIHHSTVQDHLSALYRKGWLRTSNGPAVPTDLG